MNRLLARRGLRHPFIYIAAMPRSGSTLLAGMLSKPPISHIFSEIGLNRGLTHGFDQLAEFSSKFPKFLFPHAGNPCKMLEVFARKIVPPLASKFLQVGVKECFHDNWQLYKEFLGEIRIIVLARDPRDVMLSILEYGDQVEWHRQMWADRGDEYIAIRHNQIWAQQQEMLEQANAMPLRYEDLCQKPETFAELCRFCESPLDEPGAVNEAIQKYPWL